MTHVNLIIHRGQTGVERGAWEAAQELGIRATGIAPANLADEDGLIPHPVLEGMRPCAFPGVGPVIRETVQLASAILVVVPNRMRPEAVSPVLDYASSRPGLQVMIADPSEADAVTSWLAHLPPWVHRQSSHRTAGFVLFVTGPSALEWPEGKESACRLLNLALRCP